ncbi:hypothetical protein [Methylocystis sp.]|uniref:hypothetical protein n=1 Tax=Methylocystis sp. TaxID=1911079 RepID=UPI002733046B|nr:hypothetical protein [Methylocystis sp.]MDP3552676.1 hypothetical protein [Methylocystis sp.]
MAQRPGVDGRDKPGHDAETVVQAPLADAKPSAALADQVKSLDWRARKAKKKGAATKADVAEALAKARTLLQLRQ